VTIEKGAAWGSVAMTPFDLVVAPDEAALARAVARGARHVALQSGDLLRALGTPDVPVPGRPSLQLPCDVLHVRLDDAEPVTVVGSVMIGAVMRPRAWITTGGFVGRLNVAPRAHPNDGGVDALEFASDVSLRQLLAIRRKMRAGDHLPHPALRMHRDTTYTWSTSGAEPSIDDAPVGRRRAVTMDGRRYGRARTVRVTVQPDAFILCIATNQASSMSVQPTSV